MMLVMALSMVSCGSDDEKKDDDGEGGTTVTTEYTATTEVKEVKLISGASKSECTIYIDFNCKYILEFGGGRLQLSIYLRQNGEWKVISSTSTSTYYYAGIKDLGKQNNITSITEKIIDEDYSNSVVVQPQRGYAMRFKTENEEWKYLRVYIKGYTLDDKEALSSITVQYQLY